MPPEILAPAGDQESLRAALAAEADAVYFGLDEGFNARDRARNFPLDELPQTVARVHRAGARAYVTLNTLVFESELGALERVLRGVISAGVDAIIVQDPAVALMARALCPELHVHASTQMTVSSPEGLRFAAGLGCRRVVVPRELSTSEIRSLSVDSPVELEVFIHGALCVSWSGQCLTSEAWGGRSANRGQCAQSCRLPYALIVDGERRDLGDVRYLLSPQDLAGVNAVEALAEIGVASLKIEGRLKGPAYVVSAVQSYRRRLQGQAPELTEMALAYSRGFSSGFLGGSDHQTLVEGRFPKSRGLYLGRVVAVRQREVVIAREERPWTGALALPERPEGPLGATAVSLPPPATEPPPLRPGMGVVFDAGAPEDRHEPAGPIFRVDPLPARPASGFESGGWVLGFGDPGPDLARVSPGHRVWLNSDPALGARARALAESEPSGRWAVELVVSGAAGQPLVASARAGHASASAQSQSPLSPARQRGIDGALLTEKLAAFGGTPLRLGSLNCEGLGESLHLPVSELKELRRALVASLVEQIERGPPRTLAVESPLDTLRSSALEAQSSPELRVLCRTDAQLDAVIAAGFPEVELDWMEMVGLGRAVERARAAGLRVCIATTRVQKVGEEGYDRRIERLQPDAVLVRHWGAVMHFLELGGGRPALHGDFSLNVTNSLTAAHLLGMGLHTLTVSHDLDAAQLMALLRQAPASRLTVALHHHIATFHTEHCVYAHLLSAGRDFRSCGRPCEKHQLGLEDPTGLVHPVVVDVGCRNTVFNALAQSAAARVPELMALGLRRFRVELVREDGEQTARVLAAYRALLSGVIPPREAVRRAGAHEQFGVTAGTMKTISI